MTSAPAWPSAIAMALPMPELAPVTIAFCPRRVWTVEHAGITGSGKFFRTNSESRFWFMGKTDRARGRKKDAQVPAFISPVKNYFADFPGNKFAGASQRGRGGALAMIVRRGGIYF